MLTKFEDTLMDSIWKDYDKLYVDEDWNDLNFWFD